MSTSNLFESAVITPPTASILYLATAANDETALKTAYPQSQLTIHSSSTSLSSFTPASFDYILARPSTPLSDEAARDILKLLKLGGTFILSLDPTAASNVNVHLLSLGFVDTTEHKGTSRIEIAAKKPTWEAGASAPLKLLLKKKPAATSTPAPAPAASSTVAPAAAKDVWNLASDDTNDLVDEDELLAKDVAVSKPIVLCAPLKQGEPLPQKKACKNCSCGLAEIQAGGGDEKTATPAATSSSAVTMPKSSCGSCGLGDAFRCAGCPFLGKPAFSTSSTGAVKLAL